MPVIYESDQDKYFDKEEIKIFKKGSQSGIESRGSGLFLPGIKHGNGLYLPTNKYYGEGREGGLIPIIPLLTLLPAIKTALEGFKNIKGEGQEGGLIPVFELLSLIKPALEGLKNIKGEGQVDGLEGGIIPLLELLPAIKTALEGLKNIKGEGLGEGLEGEGFIDSLISVGKAVIEGIANNASTIGQAAGAVGSVAGAASQVANAVKSVREASHEPTEVVPRCTSLRPNKEVLCYPPL